MMWKIFTAQKRKEIYCSLTIRGLFTEEQKRCRKGSRWTAELVYIYQYILNESKTIRKNLAMALIHYIKYIWSGPAKLDNKLPQNVQNITWSHKLFKENHENLESGFESRRLAEAKIQSGIFHGDSLSPLLFIIAMMKLNKHSEYAQLTE